MEGARAAFPAAASAAALSISAVIDRRGVRNADFLGRRGACSTRSQRSGDWKPVPDLLNLGPTCVYKGLEVLLQECRRCRVEVRSSI